MLYYHQILSQCWWHCAEDCFLVVVTREITASTTVSCSDRGSVAHCLPAGVCDRGLETLSSNEILLLLSVLDVTATICLISFTFPSLYFGVVPSSGAPSRFASFTKETCTWKSQRCHHYVQRWRVPVPTGPGQHAVPAAGCLHTIRWDSSLTLCLWQWFHDC